MDNNPQDSVLNACDATATVHENANASVEGLTSNLTTNNYIYRDDVVKLNDGNKVGMVTEVAGELDSESDITDDDDDDDIDDDDDDDDAEEEEDDEEEVGEREVEGDREEGKEEAGEEEEREKERGDAENEGGENIRNNDANGCADEKRNNDSLLPDQVRVLWLDDSESSHNINELALVDRGFLHGDYVASASNPTGQVGLVVDANIYVDLLTPDGSIIKDVCTRDLKRVRNITLGDFVIFGPWLGRVDDVLDNVTVLFDDGSVCKVIRADPLRLIPTNRSSIEDGHCPYYPGQRVRASSSSIFKNSLWSSGSWKANKREGTVMKISVGSVYCHWIASAGYVPESSSTPAEEQSPKNLKLLSCFTHANWQLGDWCLLPSSALSSSIPQDKGLSKLELQEDSGPAHAGSVSDEATPEESTGTSEPMDLDRLISNDGTGHCNVSSKSGSSVSSLSVSKGSAHETWPIHRKKLRKVVIKREKKIRKKEETFEKALQIVNTKTRVSVAWQDGVIENQLETTSLVPVESPGDHDFVAEQYVVERGNDDTEDLSEIRRVGVVKSVNSKEKTACVKWLKPVARPEDLREFDKEEIVSVYELEGHPDYDYCYGDVVVRLSPISLPNETNYLESGEEMQQQSGSNVLKHDTKKKPSVSEVDNPAAEDVSTEFSDLSWVGNITGLKDGDIEVTWADGMVSTVGPQAIYVVGRDDDEASVAAGSEISDAASWETVEDDDEMDAHGSEQKEPVSASDIDNNTGMVEIIVDGENNPGRNGPLSIPLAAIEFVTRLASGIFSRGRKDEDLLTTDAADEDEEFPLWDTSNPAEGPYYGSTSQVCSSNGVQVIGDKDDEECTNLVNEKPNDPPTDAGSLPLDSPSTDNYSFKHFDTAKDPLDHFFLDVDTSRNSSRKWLKKVQQDWNILQNNLPDSIYVRVYEDRMDLLRAVIVGAYGTPYQDGMFFFDFHLPAEYPDVPPSAHYHSGGWRLNPNLYEEGKVCLSLLNTWTGRGNEVWDPKCSSILQVLVSLQGLVLNSKPYFNEAGYDKQVGTAEGEKNSLSYNENTFLLNCKTIMYLIRKPPKDLDVLVKDHFKHRGYYILKACDAYMKGYLIGTLTEDASVNEKSEPHATSVGFKLMLAKILPKLYTALSELGADCSEFKHLQQSQSTFQGLGF